jgi:hypothetical protein
MTDSRHAHTLEISLASAGERRLRRQDRRKLGGVLLVLVLGGLIAELGRQPTGPAPRTLAMAPALLAFAPQPVASASAPQVVTLSNPGTTPIEIGSLALSNPAAFSWDLDCPGGRIAPGSSCALLVIFHPTSEGPAAGTIGRSATGQTVRLEGTTPKQVTIPQPPNVRASLTPERVLYGTVPIETQSSRIFTLKNSGSVELHNVRFRLAGDHLGDFHFSGAVCERLAPGSECAIAVSFAPHEEGAHSATLLASASVGELSRATLAGTGELKPQAVAEIVPNPLDLSQKSRDGSVMITNVGRAPLAFQGFSLDNSKDFEIRPQECMAASPLSRGQSCRVMVVFKGKRSAQGLMTVKQEDPSVSANVMLAAEVPPSTKKKWAAGLFVVGAITATALAAAAQSGSGTEAEQPSPRNTTTDSPNVSRPPETKLPSPPPNAIR